MKYGFAVFAVLFLLSCGNHPTPDHSSSQIVIKDSGIIRKEAANPYVQVDVSPMDMAYFPSDFPVNKMNAQVHGEPMARVIYSRPHRGGRKLFGGLVMWGQPWRLGANEATEIQFFQPVTIQNKKIPKGTYLMYAIPFENKWTIVLNSNLYSWGLKFEPRHDVAKFEVPAVTKAQMIEHLTLLFEKTTTGADLLMAWENVEVRLPIQF